MKTRAWIIFGLLALIVALPLVMRRQTATTGSRKADDHSGDSNAPQRIDPPGIRRGLRGALEGNDRALDLRRLAHAGRHLGDPHGARCRIQGGGGNRPRRHRRGHVFRRRRTGFHQPGEKRPARSAAGVRDPSGVVRRRTARFPETFTGERYYPPDHVWVGTCMSQFGICYNPDVLKRLGIPAPDRLERSRRSGIRRHPRSGGSDQERFGRPRLRVVSPRRNPARADGKPGRTARKRSTPVGPRACN